MTPAISLDDMGMAFKPTEPPKPKTTATFVFLGTVSEAPDAGIKLTRFGQRVELPPVLAEETAHDGGLPCIPAEDFDPLMEACKVDKPMLKKFGPTASHPNSPAAFQALVKRSREILHGRREPVREAFRKAQEAARAAALLAEQPVEVEEAD